MTFQRCNGWRNILRLPNFHCIDVKTERATPTTLLIVPYLFAMLRRRNDGVAAYGVFEELPDE